MIERLDANDFEIEKRRDQITKAIRLEKERIQSNIGLAEQHGFNEEDIILHSGGIPLDAWVRLALYGPNGYYGSGRAKINQPRNDYATLVGSLDDVASLFLKAMSHLPNRGDRNQPLKVLSLNHGGGDLERNVSLLKTLHPDQFGSIQLHSIDVAEGMILKSNHPNRSIADASALPFADESFDIVFSNELYDALDTLIFLQRGGRWYTPYVGFDHLTATRLLFHKPVTDIETELIALQLACLSDQNLNHPANSELLVPILAMAVQAESARVVKPSGVVLSSDYVTHDQQGNYYNQLAMFPSGELLRPHLDQYTGGDITTRMDPNVLRWAGSSFGLQTVEIQTQGQVVTDYPFQLLKTMRATLSGDSPPPTDFAEYEIVFQKKR